MDERLGWRLTANTSVTHHSRYFDAMYRTNAIGFRDRPRDPSRDAQSSRMLVYGDSQIFGWGVAVESRFTDRIEARTPHRQVWNLAVPGYGLDQEILSYEADGDRFHADEVAFFVSNDTLDRIRTDYIYRKHKPKFVLDGETLTLTPVEQGATAWSSALYRVLSPLYLPYFVERRLALLRSTFEATDESHDNVIGDEGPIDELAERILERAQSVAEERGHRMTVLVDLPEAATMALERHCEQNGIGFLKVGVPETADLRFGNEDRHWTPAAHQLVAEQLLAQLASRDRD